MNGGALSFVWLAPVSCVAAWSLMNEPMVEDLDGVFFGVVARLLGEDFGDGFGDGFGDLVRAGEAAARFFGGISIERGDTCKMGRARAWRRVEHCEKFTTVDTHPCDSFSGSGTLYDPQFYCKAGKHKAAHARAGTHIIILRVPGKGGRTRIQ